MTNANRFVFFSFTAIEAQIKELQTKRKEITTEAEAQKGVGLLESGNYFDSELYETSGSKSSKYEGYVTSIAPNDDGDDDDDVGGIPVQSSNGGPKRAFNPVAHAMKEIVQVRRARDFNRLAFINPIPFAERARLRSLCGPQTTDDRRKGGRVPPEATSLGHFARTSGSLCGRYVCQSITLVCFFSISG